MDFDCNVTLIKFDFFLHCDYWRYPSNASKVGSSYLKFCQLFISFSQQDITNGYQALWYPLPPNFEKLPNFIPACDHISHITQRYKLYVCQVLKYVTPALISCDWKDKMEWNFPSAFPVIFLSLYVINDDWTKLNLALLDIPKKGLPKLLWLVKMTSSPQWCQGNKFRVQQQLGCIVIRRRQHEAT